MVEILQITVDVKLCESPSAYWYPEGIDDYIRNKLSDDLEIIEIDNVYDYVVTVKVPYNFDLDWVIHCFTLIASDVDNYIKSEYKKYCGD